MKGLAGSGHPVASQRVLSLRRERCRIVVSLSIAVTILSRLNVALYRSRWDDWGVLARPQSRLVRRQLRSAFHSISFRMVWFGRLQYSVFFTICNAWIVIAVVVMECMTSRMRQFNYVVDDAFVSLAVWLAGCFLRACSLHDVLNRTTTIYSANGSEAMLQSVIISSMIHSRRLQICTDHSSCRFSAGKSWKILLRWRHRAAGKFERPGGHRHF